MIFSKIFGFNRWWVGGQNDKGLSKGWRIYSMKFSSKPLALVLINCYHLNYFYSEVIWFQNCISTSNNFVLSKAFSLFNTISWMCVCLLNNWHLRHVCIYWQISPYLRVCYCLHNYPSVITSYICTHSISKSLEFQACSIIMFETFSHFWEGGKIIPSLWNLSIIWVFTTTILEGSILAISS